MSDDGYADVQPDGVDVALCGAAELVVEGGVVCGFDELVGQCGDAERVGSHGVAIDVVTGAKVGVKSLSECLVKAARGLRTVAVDDRSHHAGRRPGFVVEPAIPRIEFTVFVDD